MLGARQDLDGTLLMSTSLDGARPYLDKATAPRSRDLCIDVPLSHARQLVKVPAAGVLGDITRQLGAALADVHHPRQTVSFRLAEDVLKTALTQMHRLSCDNAEVARVIYSLSYRIAVTLGLTQTSTKFASELNRLATFKAWPHSDFRFAQPSALAQAGFYYSPGDSHLDSDRVLCYSCNISLVCWEPADEPWQEHRRHAPQCQFLTGRCPKNVSLNQSMSAATARKAEGMTVVASSPCSPHVLVASPTGEFCVWNTALNLRSTLHLRLLQGTGGVKDAVILDDYIDARYGVAVAKGEVVMAVVPPPQQPRGAFTMVTTRAGSTCVVPTYLVLTPESSRPDALRVVRLPEADKSTIIIAEVQGSEYLRVVSASLPQGASPSAAQVCRGDRVLFAGTTHMKLASCAELKVALATAAAAAAATLIVDRCAFSGATAGTVVRQVAFSSAGAGDVEDVDVPAEVEVTAEAGATAKDTDAALTPSPGAPAGSTAVNNARSGDSGGGGGVVHSGATKASAVASTDAGASAASAEEAALRQELLALQQETARRVLELKNELDGDGDGDSDGGELPGDWVQYISKSKGKPYYYNKRTKVRTWSRPTDSSTPFPACKVEGSAGNAAQPAPSSAASSALPTTPNTPAGSPRRRADTSSRASGPAAPRRDRYPGAPDQKVLVAAALMDAAAVAGGCPDLPELAVFAVAVYTQPHPSSSPVASVAGGFTSVLLSLPVHVERGANSAATATYRSSPLPHQVRALAAEPNTTTLFVLLNRDRATSPAAATAAADAADADADAGSATAGLAGKTQAGGSAGSGSSTMSINRWTRVRKRVTADGSRLAPDENDPGFLVSGLERLIIGSRVEEMAVAKPDGPREPAAWLVVLLETGAALILDPSTLDICARVEAAAHCSHAIAGGWQLFMAGVDGRLHVASLKALQHVGSQDSGEQGSANAELMAADITEEFLDAKKLRCQTFDLKPAFIMTARAALAFVPMALLEHSSGKVWGVEPNGTAGAATTGMPTTDAATFDLQFPEPVIIGRVVVTLKGGEGSACRCDESHPMLLCTEASGGYTSRAVQSHPNRGQFDFVWLSARTTRPHGHGAYVWRA